MPINIVMIIDLNCFPQSENDEKLPPLTGTDNCIDPNGSFSTISGENVNEINDSIGISLVSSVAEPQQTAHNVKWINECVLTLLTTVALEAKIGDEVDFSDFNWCYTFYNSSKEMVSKYGKKFHTLDIDSFNTFEKSVEEEFESFAAQKKGCPEINKMSCLSTAIKNIGADLPWIEPKVSTGESPKKKTGTRDRNIVFALFRVPQTDEECASFVGDVTYRESSKIFISRLLPRAFYNNFHSKLRIQLNFVDMWFSHPNRGLDLALVTYAKPIPRVLQHLDGGKVIPLKNIQFVPPGLPPYMSLLKLPLKLVLSKGGIEGNIKLPKTLTDKRQLKISPLTEDSYSQSFFSASTHSVLMSNQQQQYRRIPNKCQIMNQHTVNLHSIGHGNEFMYQSQSQLSRRKRKRDEHMDSESLETYDEDEHIKYPGLNGTTDRERDSQRLDQLVNGTRKSQLSHNNHGKNTIPDYVSKLSRISFPPSVTSVLSAPACRSRAMLEEAQRKEMIKRQQAKVLEEKQIFGDQEKRKRRHEKHEKSLKGMKDRLGLILLGVKFESDEPPDERSVIEALKDKVQTFTAMIIIDEGACLVSLAQALVNLLAIKLREYKLTNIKSAMEEIVDVPFEKLNLKIIETKCKPYSSDAFRECQLQILLKMELSWILPGTEDEIEMIKDDILKLLNIIAAYRREPPVQEFMTETLFNAYVESHCKLLVEIFRGMNVSLPPSINEFMSPVVGKDFRDDISQSSSHSSSVSNSGRRSSFIMNSKSHSAQQSYVQQSCKTNYRHGMNNPKRSYVVPGSKLHLSQKMKSATVSGGRKKDKPPIRRSLFGVDKGDRSDIKLLISAASGTGFSRSPSIKFRSPCSMKSRSPRSPSSFVFRYRSQRRLQMDDPVNHSLEGLASPDMFTGGVICPESPSTPTNRQPTKKCRTASNAGSSGTKVIKESPEVAKTGYLNKPFSRVDSLSFYSTGSNSQKSSAWEKSGTKMMAARIKGSVDLTQSLSLTDIEFLSDSPGSKAIPDSPFETDSSRLKRPIDSNYINADLPCCSKSLNINPPKLHFEVNDTNTNPNIEALIKSENFPPNSSVLNKLNTSSASPTFETPSKKVQFNLMENFTNTPSPARYNNCVTPKSILKEV